MVENEKNKFKFYNIEDVKERYRYKISGDKINRNSFKMAMYIYYLFVRKRLLIKFKLFYTINRTYFNRTPESDSLYRRRNRLIILGMTCLFYYQTSNSIFSKIEFKILAERSLTKKLVK
jgi:hypothetical protein